MRVLIAGGGTGGHVIPALAIADELRGRCGAEVRFIGTARGFETRLVPAAGYELELIEVGQLKGVSLATRMRTLFDLPLGVKRCFDILNRFQPDVVVGVGGYASGPGMVAALLKRVPTLAFEPNAAPGLANRLVGKRVSAGGGELCSGGRIFPQCQSDGDSGTQGILCITATAGWRRAAFAGLWRQPGRARLQHDDAADCGCPLRRCAGIDDSASGWRTSCGDGAGGIWDVRGGSRAGGRSMPFWTTCRGGLRPPTWCWRGAARAQLPSWPQRESRRC